MLGPAIYGTTFGRAMHYASTRLCTDAKDHDATISIVRFALKVAPFRQTKTLCRCGCLVPFVDHQGAWRSQHDALLIPNNSPPASNYLEVAVADPSNIIVMNHSTYKRQFAKMRTFDTIKSNYTHLAQQRAHHAESSRPKSFAKEP
jgi:hypothetical protein